ncbi:MAG TPA: TonB-dependent receptor, partial [Rubrivivax sp.]|nr:TonB-dependent receptor [Rubrivivax sp.]
RRGPAAVRHGGGAIGGAVEIEDRRIPREVAAGLQTRSELRAAAGQVAGVFRLDSGLANADGTGGWAWHADVHGRRQGDVRIPGSAIDPEALRQQFGLSTARNSVGRIANTASHSGGGAVGSSWVGNDGSFAGMALSTLRLDYGVPPGGHSHAQPTPGQPETAEEAVRIRARQHRLDGRAELALPWALAPLLKLRAAGTDYRHDERDGGAAATTFLHRAGELKAEINHRLLDTSDAQADPGGSVGVSFTRRRFSALGDEFFAPQTEVQGAAAFLLQAIDWAGWRLQAGLRAESQVTQPEAYALQREGLRVTKLPPRRRFQPLSASLSARRSIAATEVTLTAWSAERAPELQELYADGPHLASRTYDLGNENLDVEQLRGADIGLARRIGSLTVRGNAFHYRSDSYIVQRSVGRFYNTDARAVRFECARLESCLAVTQYEQAPARLHGYEVGAGWPWRQGEGSGGWRGEWRLDTDAVRGRLASGGDLPRLPPRRVTLGFEAQKGSWLGDARLVHARPQTRPGANETPTAGWTQLHASLHHSRFNAAGQGWSLFGIGRNLTDRTARNSTSFLRNLAPEPGRSLFVGLEV